MFDFSDCYPEDGKTSATMNSINSLKDGVGFLSFASSSAIFRRSSGEFLQNSVVS